MNYCSVLAVAPGFSENQAKVSPNHTGYQDQFLGAIQATVSILYDVLRMYACPLDTIKKATAKPEAWTLALACTIWPEYSAHGCSWCERGSGKAKENHSLLLK